MIFHNRAGSSDWAMILPMSQAMAIHTLGFVRVPQPRESQDEADHGRDLVEAHNRQGLTGAHSLGDDRGSCGLGHVGANSHAP